MNKLLRWFLIHPVLTILIMMISSGILEFYVVEPISNTLQLKHEFTAGDLILMAAMCLILGIYCVSTINNSKLQNKPEVEQ